MASHPLFASIRVIYLYVVQTIPPNAMLVWVQYARAIDAPQLKKAQKRVYSKLFPKRYMGGGGKKALFSLCIVG